MYQKPKVQRFGTLRELTEDILSPGTGDAIVFCARDNGGGGGRYDE